MLLSSDPGKKGSNFFCYGAIHFPNIEVFLFSQRGYISKPTIRQFMQSKCILSLF